MAEVHMPNNLMLLQNSMVLGVGKLGNTDFSNCLYKSI